MASLLALPEAARSTTASMVLPSHHATFLFPTVVSRPRQLQRRGQSYLFGRTRPRLQASRSPSPLPVRRRSSSARGTAHPTVSRTSDARLDDGDGQVAGRHVSYEHSSSSSTSIGSGFGLVSAFAGVVPALCATGASAAAAAGEAGAGGMGARLDAPAAISFGGVFIAFAFLQVRKARCAAVLHTWYDRRLVDTLMSKAFSSSPIAYPAAPNHAHGISPCQSGVTGIIQTYISHHPRVFSHDYYSRGRKSVVFGRYSARSLCAVLVPD